MWKSRDWSLLPWLSQLLDCSELSRPGFEVCAEAMKKQHSDKAIAANNLCMLMGFVILVNIEEQVTARDVLIHSKLPQFSPMDFVENDLALFHEESDELDFHGGFLDCTAFSDCCAVCG